MLRMNAIVQSILVVKRTLKIKVTLKMIVSRKLVDYSIIRNIPSPLIMITIAPGLLQNNKKRFSMNIN